MPLLAVRLVEVPASLCDRTLVVPGVPEQSYLWEKIASAEPTCGERMPIDSVLPSNELSCVKGWIESMVQLRKKGIREKLVPAERAPQRPYDFGRFDLVEEPWPADDQPVSPAAG
jgi:hypothetical protein